MAFSVTSPPEDCTVAAVPFTALSAMEPACTVVPPVPSILLPATCTAPGAVIATVPCCKVHRLAPDASALSDSDPTCATTFWAAVNCVAVMETPGPASNRPTPPVAFNVPWSIVTGSVCTCPDAPITMLPTCDAVPADNVVPSRCTLFALTWRLRPAASTPLPNSPAEPISTSLAALTPPPPSCRSPVLLMTKSPAVANAAPACRTPAPWSVTSSSIRPPVSDPPDAISIASPSGRPDPVVL